MLHAHTLQNVHGIIADCAAHLQGISQSLDLGEPFLQVDRSLLDRLLLSLHQVERITAFPSDGSLEGCDGILEQRVADITDTRGIVIILVIVGKSTPL